MKFKQLLEGLLLEANAKDILMTKAGLNEYNSDLLVNTFGKIAVKIFNKILEGAIKLNTENPNVPIVTGVNRYDGDTLKDKILAYFNDRKGAIMDYFGGRTEMIGVRDYIRVGLNGNFSQIQNLTIMEMVEKAKEWHEEMGSGESEYNYQETHPIILDFRNDGIGYYWVDLEESSCSEESKRMGHCGASEGILFSLREVRKVGEDHTLNRSVLTGSLGYDDGFMLQLKGPKNSKPKEEYHKFILPLLELQTEDGPFIHGFGCEYNCHNDFQISDLTNEQIIDLLEKRPDLFEGRKERQLLYKLKIIERPVTDGIFRYTISASEVGDYLNGGRDYRRNFFETILMGDTWDYWDNSEHVDWKYALSSTNNTNRAKIKEVLKKLFPDYDIDDLYNNLEEAIEDLEDSGADEIISALKQSMNQAESDAYGNHLYDELRNSLSEYGKIIEMHDTGLVIEIDLYELVKQNNIDDEVLDETFEACDDHLSCVFYELLRDDYIEKPKYYISDYYHPDADDNYFNDILTERLDEI